jgi:site-specific DNA-methyltransferase (adenine-specific)
MSFARVICADARTCQSYDRALGSATLKARLLLADPPYLIFERRRRDGDIRSASSRGPRKLDHEGVVRFANEAAFSAFQTAWMFKALARVDDDGAAAIWTNAVGRKATLAAAAEAGWPHLAAEFFWAKRTVRRSTESTANEEWVRVYERALVLTRKPRAKIAMLDGLAALSGYASESGHPHEKSFSAIAPLIRALSVRSDVVLVPFAGTGGEAAAAARLGRCVAALEIREEWAQQAARAVARASEESTASILE